MIRGPLQAVKRGRTYFSNRFLNDIERFSFSDIVSIYPEFVEGLSFITSLTILPQLSSFSILYANLISSVTVASPIAYTFIVPVSLVSTLNLTTTFTLLANSVVNLNQILAIHPILSGLKVLGVTLNESANTWVVNIETKASSQYDDYGFNSFAVDSSQRQLACAEDGIYVLNDNVESTDVISTLVQFPKTDYGTNQQKNLHEVWLGVRSSDNLIIKTVTEQGTFTYSARTKNDNLDVVRVDLGKGVKSNYWDISLLGATNLELENVEMFPIITSRRI